MKHYGDITKLNGATLPVVSIITGGSPCQDLSVAGKRAGLAGARSGLFMDQVRLIKEMRDAYIKQLQLRGTNYTIRDIRPRFMVWENVPGAFSSNGGEDFRAVLEETARIVKEGVVIPRPTDGRWTPAGAIMGEGFSIAWRQHDAQYFGVPQRRKRIALVADFGGESAPEILFEYESLPGNTEQSGEPRENTSGSIEGGANSAGEAISFQERAGKPGGGKGILIQREHTGALSTLNNQSVLDPGKKALATDIYNLAVTGEIGRTLTTPSGGLNEHMPIVIEGNGARPSHQGKGYEESETSFTLNATERHAVAYRKQGHPMNAEMGQNYEQTEVNDTLNAFDQGEARTPTVIVEKTEVYESDRRHSTHKKLEEVSETVTAKYGTGGNNTPLVIDHHEDQKTFADVAATLNAVDGPGGFHSQKIKNPEENGILDKAPVCFGGQVKQMHPQEKAATLNCMHEQQAVITYGLDRASYNQGKNAKFGFSVEEEKIGAQVAKGPGAVAAVDLTNAKETEINGSLQASAENNAASNNGVRLTSVVRRLTPLECERLQGFPDRWTEIGEWIDTKGKKHKEADSPRYKALGNSIALPFWEWMAKRMRAQLEEEEPTMGSLFDGIGGFPLVFSRAGVRPVWASEIEEFAIAVTKKRFPEEQEGENDGRRD